MEARELRLHGQVHRLAHDLLHAHLALAHTLELTAATTTVIAIAIAIAIRIIVHIVIVTIVVTTTATTATIVVVVLVSFCATGGSSFLVVLVFFGEGPLGLRNVSTELSIPTVQYSTVHTLRMTRISIRIRISIIWDDVI